MNEENNSEIIHQHSRLKWACRRGMLELDVLLGNFLESGYAGLSVADKWLFIKLLECSDPELFSWLLGSEQPRDEGLIKIVQVVKKHAKQGI